MSDQFFDKEKTRNYSLITAAVTALIFFVFKKWTWASGIALGAGAGLWNFYLLYKDFTNLFPAPSRGAADPGGDLPLKQAAASRRPSPLSMAGKFFSRYLLLAVLFFLAFKIPGVHFAGFVLGFFLVHVNFGVVSFMRLMRPAPKKS